MVDWFINFCCDLDISSGVKLRRFIVRVTEGRISRMIFGNWLLIFESVIDSTVVCIAWQPLWPIMTINFAFRYIIAYFIDSISSASIV